MNGYFLSKEDLRDVKRLCKKVGLGWESVAARPAVALARLEEFRKEGTFYGFEVSA